MIFNGPYSASGAVKVTAGDSTYFGLDMPTDGSLRIHSQAGNGVYSTSGGIRYTLSSSNVGLYAPDGSIYVVDGDSDGGKGVYNSLGNLRVSGLTGGSTALIQAKTTAVQTASAITPTWTTTPTNGNLLVYAITSDYTITTPTGWTLSTGASAVNNLGVYLFWKIASGTNDTAGWTPSGNFTVVYSQAEFSLISGTPFDVASTAQTATAAAISVTTNTIAPATGRKLLVGLLGGGANANTTDMSAVWPSITNSFTEATHGGFGASTVTIGAGVDDLGQTLVYRLVTGDGVTTYSVGASTPGANQTSNQSSSIASFVSTGS